MWRLHPNGEAATLLLYRSPKLADNDFAALVFVDAGRRRHLGAHRTAHQVVIAWIQRAAHLVLHHLVNTHTDIRVVTHALVDDLSALDHMAQPAPLLIVSIGVRPALNGVSRSPMSRLSNPMPSTIQRVALRPKIETNLKQIPKINFLEFVSICYLICFDFCPLAGIHFPAAPMGLGMEGCPCCRG